MLGWLPSLCMKHPQAVRASTAELPVPFSHAAEAFRDSVFVGYDDAIARVLALPTHTWPTPQELHEALAAFLVPHGLRLAEERPRAQKTKAQGRRPRGELEVQNLEPAVLRYDEHIAFEGTIPTRACSWHDLLGALVFATFPRAKRALHERQARLVPAQRAARDGKWKNRGPEADLLARVDEGGTLVFVHGRDPVPSSWSRDKPVPLDHLLLPHRAFVFGHGALEMRVLGRPLGRSTLLVVPVDVERWGWTAGDAQAERAAYDRALEALLRDTSLQELRAQAFVARFDDVARYAKEQAGDGQGEAHVPAGCALSDVE